MYNKKELNPYLAYVKADSDLIPINVWNKMVKGKERGKTPVHTDWTTRDYKVSDVESWISKGYNLGYRIPHNEVVVDMDPRNYKGQDVESAVADLFGYFDFDELTENLPCVKTGGGGWHIYCTLPEEVYCGLLRETLENLPGVEFKRLGRQVLCAGSKHPSGSYYTWVNSTSPKQDLPESILTLIQRPEKTKSNDYSSGKGCLTGQQLQDLVLSKLNPEDFASNDDWFPLLCGAHHATDGQGIEEFVAWSLQDPFYSDDENTIRTRWESLWDKDNATTIGTLIRQLDQQGQDSKDVKAILSFGNTLSTDDDEDESDEAVMLKESKRLAAEIDIGDIFNDPEMEEGVAGRAVEAAMELRPTSDSEDIMRCLRLIKAADTFEAMRAQEILVTNKVMKQSNINKMLKELDTRLSDDLALLLSRKTLEVTFNKGKHLTCPPSGLLWAYHKTHWKPISDEFLAKLVQSTLHGIKEKTSLELAELTLIQQAVKLARIQVSTLTDRIFKKDMPASVINCKNGELWINKDGSHVLKPHTYRSYLINCLNVDYDPSAECPLFMQTLTEIFAEFEDSEEMIRHIGELMGYTAQPYKNIASWWLFRGPGGDGKSTILKIMEAILQDSQLMTTVKLLSAGTDTSNNHALNSLVGKLAVVVEELPAGYLLKDAGVKMFSENTKMEANPKGRDTFHFMYSGNLIMCSNGWPATRDLSHGMFRRANVIPFSRQFTKHGKADIDRALNIIQNPKEMAGVLNFMLEGLQRLRQRGKFLVPESCKQAKDEWFGHANNVVRFLKEKVEFTGNANEIVADFSDFYGIVYNEWCQDNDIDEKMRKRKSHFKQDLISLGYSVRVGGGNTLKVYGGKLLDGVKSDVTCDFDGLEDCDSDADLEDFEDL